LYCSVLSCVAVCCGECCSKLQFAFAEPLGCYVIVLLCDSVLQCVAVCCSVLICVAVSVAKAVAVGVAVCGNVLQ